MRFLKGHILSFVLLSMLGLSTVAMGVDCKNYKGTDEQKALCKYYRIQTTGARPILCVNEDDVEGSGCDINYTKKNQPFYVYAPDIDAVPDTVTVFLCKDPDAKSCERDSDVDDRLTPVVSTAGKGITKLGLENKYERYNFRLGTATDLSAEPKVDLVYNFYVPRLRYTVDGEVVTDKWELPDSVKAGDVITVEVETIIPVGPRDGEVDSLTKTFYISLDGGCKNLVFMDLNGNEKTVLADGTIPVDFINGYAKFLVTATKAIKDGSTFTMNSFKDPATEEFLLKDPFPGELHFSNPDKPDIERAAMYDNNGDGVGDSIAAWFGGKIESMSLDTFHYSWPGPEWEKYSGEIKGKDGVYEFPDVNVELLEYNTGAVQAYICYAGDLCEWQAASLVDSIGAVIQSATLLEGKGDKDTLVVRFSKEMDKSWTSGYGLKVNGEAIDVEAILKNGTQWAFTVKKGTVAANDMLKIETSCNKKECPDGILTAADGVPTSKNNQEVPVLNSGRFYVDNDKNGFYDRDGDGRMDSISLGFESPVTQADLDKMEITFYWLDNEGDLVGIPANSLTSTISDDGTLVGFAVENPDAFGAGGIMKMLTGIDSTYSSDGETNYGFVKIINKITVEGKSVADPDSLFGMNDYMAPVISSTFLNPESFQKMEPDKFKISFSEAMDKKNVNLTDDCLAFYVDGQWVHYSLTSSEWSDDGRELVLYMEAGEDLASRMNPADSVRFDNFTSGLVDKKGNKVSELSPAVMVEGDPRVIMKTNSFADLNKAEELSDRVKPFTIETVKDAKQASDQSSLGVLMDIGYSTIMEKDSSGESVPNMEDIGLHWELYVYTNIGNYVGGASGSIACDDKFFGGNCLENPDKLYVRWNMRAANGRKVGAGIYLAKFRVKVYGAKEDFKVERIFRWGISAKKSK